MKIHRRKAFLEFAARARYELHRSLCLVTDKGPALGAMAWSWEELPEMARVNQRMCIEGLLDRGPDAVPITSPAVMVPTHLDQAADTLVFLLLQAWQRGPRRKVKPDAEPPAAPAPIH